MSLVENIIAISCSPKTNDITDILNMSNKEIEQQMRTTFKKCNWWLENKTEETIIHIDQFEVKIYENHQTSTATFNEKQSICKICVKPILIYYDDKNEKICKIRIASPSIIDNGKRFCSNQCFRQFFNNKE